MMMLPIENARNPITTGFVTVLPFKRGGNGSAEVNGESYPPVCEHCGGPEKPDEPVLPCGVRGQQYLLHLRCQEEWLAGPDPDAWSFNLEDRP